MVRVFLIHFPLAIEGLGNEFEFVCAVIFIHFVNYTH